MTAAARPCESPGFFNITKNETVSIYHNMYEELKSLFGKAIPSVRRFDKLLEKFSPEQQSYYHQLAYKAAPVKES